MTIHLLEKYRARIRYHRTDDLKPDALPDGTELVVQAVWVANDGEKFAGDWVFMPLDGGYNLPERDLEIIEAMTNTRTYRATREITLEFPDPKHGAKYLTINAGDILTGEVADGFLYFITEFGPARILLVLLEPAK